LGIGKTAREVLIGDVWDQGDSGEEIDVQRPHEPWAAVENLVVAHIEEGLVQHGPSSRFGGFAPALIFPPPDFR
jgi:hypothetical protein